MYYAIFFNFRTGKILTELYRDTNTLLGSTTWTCTAAPSSLNLLAKSSTEEPTRKAPKHGSSDYATGGILVASAISVAAAALCVIKRKREDVISDDFARI